MTSSTAASSHPFVVLAEFSVTPEQKADFLEVCAEDSRSSVANEPGCQSFDLLTSEESPETIILYEIYDDRAAFDAHMATPHYATFYAGVKKLNIAEPKVRFLSRQTV